MNNLPPLNASHNDIYMSFLGISMITLSQWPDGEWKAWGWRYVHIEGKKSKTIEEALRSLIDAASAHEKERLGNE